MDMQEAAFTVTLCDYPSEGELGVFADFLWRHVLQPLYERQGFADLLGTAELAFQHAGIACLGLVAFLLGQVGVVTQGDAKLAFTRWMKAARAATEAGMQGLGDGECSFFEVRRGWRH